MASTYSALLRLELVAKGEQPGTWDVPLNLSVGTLMEHAIAGYKAINITTAGTAITLSTANGAVDEARYAVLGFSGTQGSAVTCTIPNVSKTYWVVNGSNQPITMKASGAGAVVPAGSAALVICDGAVTTLATPPAATATGKLADTALPSLSISGGSVFGTTPSATTPVIITSSTVGVALDMRGRASDGLGMLRMLSNDGATEYARMQVTSGGLAILVGATPATAFQTDAAGNVIIPKSLTASIGLTVTAGGLAVNAGGATIVGDIITYRSGAVTTGAIYFGNGGTRYLYWDGVNYTLGGTGGDLYVGGQRAWTAGNLNPALYAQKTGDTFTGQVYAAANLQVRGAAPMLELHAPGVAACVFYVDGAGTKLFASGGGFNPSTQLWITTNAGDFTASGNVAANSDARLKKDVHTIAGALDLVRQLRGVRYRRKDTGAAGIGFIAQEVHPVVPELVLGDPDDGEILSVAYGNTVALLVEAVKDLADQVEALRAR